MMTSDEMINDRKPNNGSQARQVRPHSIAISGGTDEADRQVLHENAEERSVAETVSAIIPQDNLY